MTTYDMTATYQWPAMVELNKVLPLLGERDRSFAMSLQAQQAYRLLSDNKPNSQMFWVGELTKRGQAATPKRAFAPAVTPVPSARAVTFERIAALFAKAGQHAVLIFKTASGTGFRLSVAGERSSNPGSINVTDTSRSFESRVWFGRITQQGGWVS